MGKSVYEIVTDQIIEMLKDGVVPWKRPWSAGNQIPFRWEAEKHYTGLNTILLPPGEYATFKQIQKAKGQIKKSERKKSYIAVFFKPIEVEDKEKKGKDETKKAFVLRYYRVWNIVTQCTGMKPKQNQAKTFEHDPITEGERIVENFIGCPDIHYGADSAFYRPFYDDVHMPSLQNFYEPEEFYSTLFHELIHSTGHKDRLNRKTLVKNARFGSQTYSKEELVAEIGANMVCAHAGIKNDQEQTASYIDSWLKALKSDPQLIVQASGQAQKATDHILGIN